MVHMLERAREVHALNHGTTHRDSEVKCPFCVADEDEQWFKFKFEYQAHPEVVNLERPKKMPAPHCINCPLLNVMHKAVGHHPNHVRDVQGLMDDCVKIGHFILNELWEGSDEESG
jgi:hypothetical protein